MSLGTTNDLALAVLIWVTLLKLTLFASFQVRLLVLDSKNYVEDKNGLGGAYDFPITAFSFH